MYLFLCVCVYLWMYSYIYMYIHIYSMYTHVYTCIYIHTHIYHIHTCIHMHYTYYIHTNIWEPPTKRWLKIEFFHGWPQWLAARASYRFKGPAPTCMIGWCLCDKAVATASCAGPLWILIVSWAGWRDAVTNTGGWLGSRAGAAQSVWVLSQNALCCTSAYTFVFTFAAGCTRALVVRALYSSALGGFS